jgi:hypothetical protein
LSNRVRQVIPPSKNAVIRLPEKEKPLPDYLIGRNKAVEDIRKQGSKGYHQRNLNEVVMFRYKTIFGGDLTARKIENRISEVKLKYRLSNLFTQMGMSERTK